MTDEVRTMMYGAFIRLTPRKKLDYLYTMLVEDDLTKLYSKYGPTEVQVRIDDDEVLIVANKIKDINNVKEQLISDGYILVDGIVNKDPGTKYYVGSYILEGQLAPICLN